MVTGTDTGVGKTVVTCALVHALRLKGQRPFPIKPIETGCVDLSQPEDGLALSTAAGGLPLELVCPVRYHAPAAPATAARLEGAAHTFDGVVEHIKTVQAKHSLVVVEGAGGLLVPLGEGKTFADLAVALGASLVVVARDALGTINHTSLTLEAAIFRGMPVLAVVLNAVAARDAFFIDHRAELEALWPGVPILDSLCRVKNPESSTMSSEKSIKKLSDMITDT